MYKKIETLDDLTINKIAAGEVVEGPHSVVKELVENSIDAGATIITLDIKSGGKTYIRVTDNGVGIKEEDVEKAFLRHSTSKILNINDLSTISSLGFRGEALASIAAVSQVEIVTRPKEQQYGILLEISGGGTVTRRKVGCPVGTTIIVKNLFFNTPARLKFMKSNSAETTKISEIITRLSLSHPSISFKYVNNNNIMYTTPGNDKLCDAILSALDKNTFKNLIYLENQYSNMKLQGYISQPDFVRGNRNLQIIYINGRYVKDKLISRAIEDAYKEKITINRYPICILNLYIDPSQLDVNVHPAKVEVKFEDGDHIYDFVYRSVSETLEKNATIPKLTIDREVVNKKGKAPLSPPFLDTRKKVPRNDTKNGLLIKEDKGSPRETDIKNISRFIDQEINNYAEQLQYKSIEVRTQVDFLNILLDDYKIIGQIFNTYIILEKDQSIYLIDQHAAHERLIYNQFLQEINNEKLVSQVLVEPEVFQLSNEDCTLLFHNIDLFTKLGFSIKNFGTNTAIIREVPLVLGRPQNFSFIYDILDEIRNRNDSKNYFEDTIIKKACKAAIKGKDKLDYYEMKALIEKISALKPPLTCPHGRPIILTMSQYDIEKHFKRI